MKYKNVYLSRCHFNHEAALQNYQKYFSPAQPCCQWHHKWGWEGYIICDIETVFYLTYKLNTLLLFSFKLNNVTVAQTTVRAQMWPEPRVAALFMFSLFLKYWRITSNIKTGNISLCLRIEPALSVLLTLRDTSLLKHITASVLLDTELKNPVSSEATTHIKLQRVQRFNSIWYCSETSGSFREADSCDFCSKILQGFLNQGYYFNEFKKMLFWRKKKHIWLKVNKCTDVIRWDKVVDLLIKKMS